MSTVDTSSYKLTLFAAMSTSASQEALQQRMLKPEFFMKTTTERAWIPMNKSPEEALKRAHWGAPERGENDLHPKRDFRVFQIEFTAHGFGYFHLANVLTTQAWKHWRFYGDIYETVRSEESGDILVHLTDYQEII